MRMLGAYPERYGDQDVDHEQDESLPTNVERVVSALDQTGARLRSQCSSHPVGPAVRQSYEKTRFCALAFSTAPQDDDRDTNPD
jgi:hypothetical protein